MSRGKSMKCFMPVLWSFLSENRKLGIGHMQIRDLYQLVDVNFTVLTCLDIIRIQRQMHHKRKMTYRSKGLSRRIQQRV
jgi:hypothetical protein